MVGAAGSPRPRSSSTSAPAAATGSPCSHPRATCSTVSGEFLEIAPPSWLSYTFRWDEPTPDDRETVVELTVDEFGGAAVLSLWQGEFATGERLVLHRHGWTDSLDKLSALLETRPEGARAGLDRRRPDGQAVTQTTAEQHREAAVEAHVGDRSSSTPPTRESPSAPAR